MSLTSQRSNAQLPHSQSALAAEMDGVREAIRLNWLDLERSDMSSFERQAIRANVAELVQLLAGLIRQCEDLDKT